MYTCSRFDNTISMLTRNAMTFSLQMRRVNKMMIYWRFHIYLGNLNKNFEEVPHSWYHWSTQVPVPIFCLTFNVYEIKQIFQKHLPMKTLTVSRSCKICLFLLFKGWTISFKDIWVHNEKTPNESRYMFCYSTVGFVELGKKKGKKTWYIWYIMKSNSSHTTTDEEIHI